MADDDDKVAEPQAEPATAQAIEGPDADGVIDLDKRKAARLEGKKVKPVVVFEGKTFELPRELPYDLLELMSEVIDSAGMGFSKPLDDTLEALLGKKGLAKLKELKPSVDDVGEMMAAVLVLYGLTAGESPASSDS